jgi:hypothetical protein
LETIKRGNSKHTTWSKYGGSLNIPQTRTNPNPKVIEQWMNNPRYHVKQPPRQHARTMAQSPVQIC